MGVKKESDDKVSLTQKQSKKLQKQQQNEARLASKFGQSDLTGKIEFHDGPSYETNAAGKIILSPVVPLVRYGAKHSVEHHHLWKLKARIATSRNWEKFSAHWESEKQLPRPNILKPIFNTFGIDFLKIIGLQFIYAASQYALPLLMPYLVKWFTFSKILPLWWVFVYSVAIFAAGVCGSLFNYHSQLRTWSVGLRLRGTLTTLIYRKALYTILGRTQTSGKVVNLMSTDAQILLETLPMFVQGLLAPVQIAVTLGLLSTHLGVFSLISLAVAFLCAPIVGFLANRMTTGRMKVQQRGDIRIKFVKEFLTAIRIVKYYAWERPFVNNIDKTRHLQLIEVKAMQWSRALLVGLLTNVPGLGIGFTFFFYGIRNTMDFDTVFSALTYLNMLRIPFIFLPMIFAFGGQYLASLQRIQFFALRSEIDPKLPDKDPQNIGGMYIKDASFSWETQLSIAESRFVDLEQKETEERELLTVMSSSDPERPTLEKKLEVTSAEKVFVGEVVRELQLRLYEHKKRHHHHQQQHHDDDHEEVEVVNDSMEDVESYVLEHHPSPHSSEFTPLRKPVDNLKNISFNVQKGSLTMVVGSVGSGKSTIAMCFLGEITKTAGKLWVSGQIAYASQEAWILNATIRDNITFGKEYDPVWYAEVIRACALTTDLLMFPASDLTEIGERGTNLSGGQRQRINVARAMYSKSPIVILDDPFSAVDAHVGDHMFTNVAQGMRDAGRTVLLITNQLHFLPNADYIGVLKKGKMVEQGIYSSLISNKEGFLSKMIAKQNGSSEASHNVTVTEAEQNEQNKARDDMKKSKDVKFIPSPEKDEEYRKIGALIKAEQRERGNIKWQTYWEFIRAGSLKLLLVVLGAQVVRTATRVMGGIWLSWWGDVSNPKGLSKNTYLGGYIGFVLGETALTFVGSITFLYFAIRAGTTLHHTMLIRVSRSPTGWFDATPLGRIINRFSKDMDFIDFQLPMLIEQTLNFSFILIGIFASIATGTAYVLIIIAVGIILFGALTMYYRKTSIQIQRLEALSRAPIFSHFTETLEGAVTIRAYGLSEAFKTANLNKIDANTVDFMALRYCASWFGLTLDMLGNIVILLSYIALLLVRYHLPEAVNLGYMIFALSNTGGITQALAAVSNSITDLENKMNSAERVMEYDKLPSEAPETIEETKPEPDWPAQGEIVIDNLTVEYKKDVPVLKNLSCSIKPREKIGIVGRTGAGKSTLITALFRTIEPVTGSIIIDGVDITQIGLFDLRSKLSIIPQMPQLFVGNVRYNLDPFDEHTDDELWKVLKMVKLKSHVKSMEAGLYSAVEEGGSNFSVGQRQLLSMARCLLRQTHVLLLDEATAAVDAETDALLQSMIRKNFKDKTVLTIAHRLNTIMDSDRIMVLDAGRIVEFGSPKKLLSTKGGVLFGMVEAMGSETAAFLRSIAEGTVSVEEAILKDSQISIENPNPGHPIELTTPKTSRRKKE